jgi:hypothetical protein
VSNFFGGLVFGLMMLLNLIGLLGMFVCYLIMPLRSLWMIYRKFKPNNKFTIHKKNFRISIWFLCSAFAAIAAYHLFVLNIKYPDTLLTAIFHIIPFGFFSIFEYFQEKSSVVSQRFSE